MLRGTVVGAAWWEMQSWSFQSRGLSKAGIQGRVMIEVHIPSNMNEGKKGASGDSQAPAACSFLERQPKSKASLGKASPRQSSLAPGTLPDQGL